MPLHAFQRFLFILFLFVALSLRFYDLGGKPLWYDELVTFTGSWLRGGIWESLAVATGDLWGMVYGKILLFFALEISPFSLRFFSALQGVLLVPVAFFLAPFRDRIPLALWFLLTPFVHYYSQEARPYIGVVLTATGIWLLLYSCESRGGGILTRYERFSVYALQFTGGFFSPFFYLGAGFPLGFLLLRFPSRLRGIVICGSIALLHGVFFLLWFRYYDQQWFQELGFHLGGLSADHLKALFAWLLGTGTEEGFFFLIAFILFVLGFITSLRIYPRFTFSFLACSLIFWQFFAITQHYFGFRYFAGVVPGMILLVYRGIGVCARGISWILKIPIVRVPLLTTFFSALYLIVAGAHFYPSWYSLPLKPTMITSTHAGLEQKELPDPHSKVIIFTHVDDNLEGSRFRVLPSNYPFLNLIEIYGIYFLHPEFRHKEIIFLGGSRGSHPYHFGARNAYDFSEEEIRKYGWNFRICYKEEWQHCLANKEGPWEVYVDSYILFKPLTFPPCNLLGNNPCFFGIRNRLWVEHWRNSLEPVCWDQERIMYRSYGSAIYLKIFNPEHKDLQKIADFFCYRIAETRK